MTTAILLPPLSNLTMILSIFLPIPHGKLFLLLHVTIVSLASSLATVFVLVALCQKPTVRKNAVCVMFHLRLSIGSHALFEWMICIPFLKLLMSDSQILLILNRSSRTLP